MSRSVVMTRPGAPAADAARLMLDHKIGALPVVDRGRLVGIVTDADFVRGFTRVAPTAAA